MRGNKLKIQGQIGATGAAVFLALCVAATAVVGVAYSQGSQPPPQTEPAPAPAAPPPTVPPAVTILNNHEVEGVLGRDVVSTANEDMGRIVDVIVDRSGEVRAAIIDFGGFLGVGSRKIAVDWNALHFPSPSPGHPDAKITLDLTRDQVKAAPEYQEGKPVVVLAAQGKLEPLPFE